MFRRSAGLKWTDAAAGVSSTQLLGEYESEPDLLTCAGDGERQI